MPRPEVKVSKLLLKHFFNIREDALEFPDGRQYDHVSVESPDTASIVMIRNEKITLAGEYRHSAKRLIWSLPAGYVEEGETPEEAIIRECQEEAGLKPTNIEHLITSHIWSGISAAKTNIFFASEFEESKLDHDDNEDIIIREFSMAEVNKFLQSGGCDASFALGVLRAKEKGLMDF